METSTSDSQSVPASAQEQHVSFAESPKKSPLTPLLLSILGILAVGGMVYGGYWYGGQSKEQQQKTQFTNEQLGYSVLYPQSWYHQKDQLCEGDEFSDYEPTPNPIDAYRGFLIRVCLYRNTTLQNYLQKISAYGSEKENELMVDGKLPQWFEGAGMIGELNTILIERYGNVYRFTVWLPPAEDNGYYEEEKGKLTDFLTSFRFSDK